MRRILQLLTMSVGVLGPACASGHAPYGTRTTGVADHHQDRYFWRTLRTDNSAQLVTLFCRACGPLQVDEPLVTVLRDTLGDARHENDRLTYVWLLTYAPLSPTKRLLGAVPFLYWHVGRGTSGPRGGTVKPLVDVSAPQDIAPSVEREIVQWTLLDPITMPIRATSRAYESNERDHERLHLEEAISYLRLAPAGEDGLSRNEIDLATARLELRKRLLGGLVNSAGAQRLGEDSRFEQERVRGRNWELLRQCAEKTGLVFEPLSIAGASDSYAVLWFPLHGSAPPPGVSTTAIWKLLNITDPWRDKRLKDDGAAIVWRDVDEHGDFVRDESKAGKKLPFIALGVYSLSYSRMPLLMVDCRNSFHLRRHEVTQRTINEITGGVIGLSHFANWYYYVAADLYDFISERRGDAVNQAERLDTYSRFRSALALDTELDPDFREDLERRAKALAVNPMEESPDAEMRMAADRERTLEREAADGTLSKLLDKSRRAELAYLMRDDKSRSVQLVWRDLTFGLYTDRVPRAPENVQNLRDMRLAVAQIAQLQKMTDAGTAPEVTFDSSRIQDTVHELGTLMPYIHAQSIRAQAKRTLQQLATLSADASNPREGQAAAAQLDGPAGEWAAAVRAGVPSRAAAR